MKIIHCADLHLDSKMESHLDSEKAKERKRELLFNFSRLVAFATEQSVAAILISGDLFDTSRISKTAKSTVLTEIETHPEIGFYYLRGNHDQDDFLKDVEIPENLYLFSDTWKTYELPGVRIAGVEFNNNENEIYSALNLSDDLFNIVMLHGQESRSNAKDKTEVINLQALKNHHIDYLALGHIHKHKLEKLEGNTFYCYPGCLEGRGFDETGEHGFMLLDIQGKGSAEVRFVNFAKRIFSEVEADITGLEENGEIQKKILETLETTSLQEKDIVQILLRGTVSETAEYDVRVLEKLFEDRYYLLRIKDKTATEVNLSRYEKDDSLQGEFVRSVMQDPEISEKEKGEVIRIGLRAFGEKGGVR